ncbi:class I SAM-dependent methyltransferase [Isoptericola croceus]|uniref:class I SAM-dependent methyltransferase n=1 Tax=Isoptericola croceus TaxID=3031406 RepID=UPI0023F7B0AE|nr:methyltransferase domain-containing protein [Isoptericola croceus]
MAGTPVASWRCRWCAGAEGTVVLDLGEQPAADVFPPVGTADAEARYPLRMVLCAGCGLAQLEDDPTEADEPRGVEPAALVAQAREAVADLAAAELAEPGASAAEFPSPHGGSWSGLLAAHGLTVLDDGGAVDGVPADLVVDSLGMMHDPDQRAALAARADRLTRDGVLALHVHPLGTILRTSAWNALRHGHYAYYSVSWLVRAARDVGFVPVGLWRYSLYGGTVVLALARAGSRPAERGAGTAALAALRDVLDEEDAAGVTNPRSVGRLQDAVTRTATALRSWLDDHRAEGVVGYGAASRAVSLLAVAGATGADMIAVVDASPAKEGLSMPGTRGSDGTARVPIVDPSALTVLRPRWVVLFVPDLLDEVRRQYPEVEASGGRWVVAEPTPVVVGPDPIRTR